MMLFASRVTWGLEWVFGKKEGSIKIPVDDVSLRYHVLHSTAPNTQDRPMMDRPAIVETRYRVLTNGKIDFEPRLRGSWPSSQAQKLFSGPGVQSRLLCKI